MNRSDNRKLGRIVALVLCVCLCLTGCGERRSRQFTAIGDTQLRLGHADRARDAYEKALSANPKNLEAYLGLARAHRLSGDDAAALAAYEKARGIDPASAAANVEAVDVLLKNNRMDEARALATTYADHDPERGGLLLAQLEVRAGDSDAALARLEALREKFATSSLVRVALAKLYTALERYADAENELDVVLNSIDPDSLTAHMARVDVFARQGKVNDMLAELESFSKRNPDNVTVQLAYARALLMAGRVDDAEAVVKPIVEARPDNGWANFVLGECLLKKGAFDEAIVCLQAARQSLPEEKAVQDLLQSALTRSKPATETAPVTAEGEAGSVRATTPVAAEKDDWRTLWREARLRELLDTIQRQSSEDPEISEFQVAAALLLNRTEQAKTLGESLPETSPVRKALRLLEEGKSEPLFDFLETWTEDNPIRADLRDNLTAYSYALAGRRAAAIRVLAQALSERPEYLLPLLHSAVIYGQAAMPEFQTAALRRMASLCPSNLDAQVALCETLWRTDQPEEALTQAQALFAVFPENPEVLRILGKAYREVNDLDAAAQALNRALEKAPNDPGIALQLAEIEIVRGDIQRAKGLLADKTYEGPAKDAADFLHAVVGMKGNTPDEVIAIWQQGRGGERIPLALRYVCAAAYVVKRDTANAITTLQPASEASGRTSERTAVARYALGDQTVNLPKEQSDWARRVADDPEALADFLFAYGLVEGRLEPLAQPILGKLEERVGQSAVLNTLAVRVLSARQSAGDALQRMKAYAEQHRDDPAVWLALAGVARKKNDGAAEADALQKALALAPEAAEVWAALANLYDRQQDYANAAEANRKLLSLLPDRPDIQNNFAYSLLQSGGDVQEALKLATAAAERLKANPYVLHTLGLAYRKAGRFSEAQERLAAALELRPGDPTLLYEYGRTLMDMNKRREGLQHIELAVLHARQLNAAFPALEEAEALLQGEREKQGQGVGGTS